MDIISFNEASTANGRIENFIENPDSTSGVLTVPKTIAAGETITIPAGRVAILPDLQVDGDLVVDGDLFIPTGSMTSQVVQKVTSTDNAVVRFNGTTGDVQNSGVIIDDNNNITQRASLYKRDDGVSVASIDAAAGTALSFNEYTGGGYRFYTSSVEKMRIDGAGNVGIGITPSAWASNVRVIQPGLASMYGVPNSSNCTIGANYYYNGTNSKYIIAGASTAYQQLNGVHMWLTAPYGAAEGNITFNTAMTLDASGNLGIGTSSPINKLDIINGNQGVHITSINADPYYGSVIMFDNDSGQANKGWRIGARYSSTTGTAFVLETKDSTYAYGTNPDASATTGFTERLRIDASGNVGIGVTPLYSLHIKNATSPILAITDSTGNSTTYMQTQNGMSVIGSLSNNPLSIRTNDTERMRVDASGNVGIGTTPSAWVDDKAIQLPQGSISSGYEYGLSSVANAYRTSGNIWKYNVSQAASRYNMNSNGHQWYTAPSGTAGNAITWTNAMTLDARGTLSVYSSLNGGLHTISTNSSQGNGILNVYSPTTGFNSVHIQAVSAWSANGSSSALFVGKNSTTSRSINAGGTINASGADYAEYEYSNDTTLVKGQIVGFKVDGTLTDRYSESIRFAIKSTNPSIVGGDVWGCENIVGIRPEQPVKTEEMTDEEFAQLEEQYKIDLADFEARLEVERQKVDRIAYAGKVPVNVYGAIAGQYMIATEKEDGTIDGKLVNKADMTFTEYQDAVGRVNKILDDGRAEVAVIIH